MPGIVLAWAVGEGIIAYRAWKVTKAPPMPGQLLASSGLFVLLALLAEADRARFLASALAWGFDIAAFMNIAPAVITGQQNIQKAQQAAPAQPGQSKKKAVTAT